MEEVIVEYWKCTKCGIPFMNEGAAMIHVKDWHPGAKFEDIIEKVM